MEDAVTHKHIDATFEHKYILMLQTLKKCAELMSAKLVVKDGIVQSGEPIGVEDTMCLVGLMQWAVEYAEETLFE